MDGRKKKRNKYMKDQPNIKRQKSGSDDTDGRTSEQGTPDKTPTRFRNASNKDNNRVQKELFPPGPSCPSQTSRCYFAPNGSVNGQNESNEHTEEHMAVYSTGNIADTQNGYARKTDGKRGLNKRLGAGANTGHFQFRSKGIPVSKTSMLLSTEDTVDHSKGALADAYTQNRYAVTAEGKVQLSKRSSPGADVLHFQMKSRSVSQTSMRSRQKPKTDTASPTNPRVRECKCMKYMYQGGWASPCMKKRKEKSDLDTNVDMDTVFPINIKTTEKPSMDVPANIPCNAFPRVPLQNSPGAACCFMMTALPCVESSPIFIQHSMATDDPKLGDRLGAVIETTMKRVDGYYIHMFKYVDVDGVMYNMKIRDGDQLVLINESFVPDLDHKTVLDLFRNVPVDHHTRFTLVVRRELRDRTWEWVTTSAILVPELEKPPEVRELKLERDIGSMKCSKHWYNIRIPGTQMYMTLSGGELRIEVSKYDMKDYNVCVTSKCILDQETGDMSYYACVSGSHHEDKFQDSYIHVKTTTRELCTDKEQQWFRYFREGRKMAFLVEDLQQYIGCSVDNYGTTGHLCLQDERYFFEAVSLKDSYDHTDGLEICPSSQLSSGSEPLSLSGSSNTSRSSVGSFWSCGSADSGYLGPSDRRSRTYEDPISESGSSEYFSLCSHSAASCGTPNTPMSNLCLFPKTSST